MDLTRQAFKRILLIKPSSLGDIVHALPIIHGLRLRYPKARLSWLVSTSCLPLLEGHPAIDELIPFDRKRYGRMLRSARIAAEFAGFVRQLRRRRFDLVIDLQGLFRSGFMAWACGSSTRIGFAAARELAWIFYTHRIQTGPPDEHAVDRNYRLAEMLGFSDVLIAFPLAVQPEFRRRVGQLLREAGIGEKDHFAVLVPAARWETKLWPADRFAAVADYLWRTRSLRSVVVGGPDEQAVCDAVANTVRESVVNLCGKTSIPELVALMEKTQVVVTNDSGPMHIAAALGRPVVCIIGPTNAARTGPYATKSCVIRRGLPCSPCYLRKLSQCPHRHACMNTLAATDVQAAVDGLLNGNAPATMVIP